MFTNDPEGLDVQVVLDVHDRYQGFVPDGYTQYSPGLGETLTYNGGPIESVDAETTEYLRTQRLSSLAEAQAILESLNDTVGQTVTISLTPSSEIVVAPDVTQTFRR
jgi:hypothetical protein